jgi:hypothetical protein
VAACATRGVFAQQLAGTASTGEGPFYPNKLPLDADNDLLIVNDAITPAVGVITHLTGRVLTVTGQPVRNAFVEIWQADNTGSYINTSGRQETGNDRNFQGYGRFLSDVKGRTTCRQPVSARSDLGLTFRRDPGTARIFTTQLVAGSIMRVTLGQEMDRRAPNTAGGLQAAPRLKIASWRLTSTSSWADSAGSSTSRSLPRGWGLRLLRNLGRRAGRCCYSRNA